MLYFMVHACLDTCCSHFLTIIAGVDLHFRHESELPVCRTQVAAVQGELEAANHYTNLCVILYLQEAPVLTELEQYAVIIDVKACGLSFISSKVI